MINDERKNIEVLIVGGGPGGLSCALSLARGGRRVLVCDDAHPRNRNTDCIRNLPGHEGLKPLEYSKLLRQSLSHYPNVLFCDSKVVSITKEDDCFISTLSNEDRINSQKVVIAEGVQDILPDIPGVMELWGRCIFHCAYCHGYESSGKKVGVIISNQKYIEILRLLRGLNSGVCVFTNNSIVLNNEEKNKLIRENVEIHEGKIIALKAKDRELQSVVLEDGKNVSCENLFIQNGVRPKSSLGRELGCELLDEGVYKVDLHGESNVLGVYFAGDVGSIYHSVIMASAVGSHVGICVNASLVSKMF